MSDTERFAIYFVPADGTPLARFGQSVLGRDALGRPVAHDPELPPTPAERVRRAAHYGFHATLKAPFRLAEGHDEAGLRAACARLASRHAPIPLPAIAPALAPARPGGFAALVLPASIAALDALEADCVRALDAWRAPLDAAALARRRPATLAPVERARLERWGYPHVLDGFRFHMTLSGPLQETPESEAWLAALARVFHRRVGGEAGAEAGAEVCVDRLALCVERTPRTPFVRVAEFPLGEGVSSPRPSG